MISRHLHKTVIIIGLYVIVSIISRIFQNFSSSKNIENDNFKRTIWKQVVSVLNLINKDIICYSLAIKENMYIRPNMLGDVFSLMPIKSEQIVVDLIKELPKESIVIDVGASIGKYTLQAAKKASRVFSLEPEKSNYTLLTKSLKLNKIHNVQAINYALSSKEGTLPLYLGVDSSTHSLIEKKKSSQIKSCVVECITLSQLLERNYIKHVDLLKMDIEGAELAVLEESFILLNRINKAVIEIHDDSYYDKIKKLFEEQGFETMRCGKFIVAKNIR